MYKTSIANDELKALPLLRFEGDIHLIDEQKEALAVLGRLKGARVLGFDTEKRPTFVKGQYHHLALVQLSTVEEAFLFRLNVLGFFDALKSLMASESVLKVGAGIADDMKALQKMNDFSPFSRANDGQKIQMPAASFAARMPLRPASICFFL